MSDGLGDIQYKGMDPLESYFDIVRQGVKLPRRRWIVKPEWTPPVIPGMEPVQKFLEDHMVPRLWQLMTDMWQRSQCGTYFVKGPNWMEPPITARNADLRTETCVVVPAFDPYVGTIYTTVINFTVPDRFIGSILGFGHEIQDPSQWGNILWRINVNGVAQPNYQDFRQQIGRFIDPTRFPSPIRFKHGDVVTVTVTNLGAAAACVFVRLFAFMFPAKMTAQDGSFVEYHTL